MGHLRRVLIQYSVAIGATAAAVYLRVLLNPLLGHRLPFITLYAAIAVTVCFGGWQPALLATLLGYGAAYLAFIRTEPGSTLSFDQPGGLAGLGAFLASSLLLIGLGNGMRTALRRAKAKEAELELITGRTPVMLTRCDRQRRFVFVNRACAEFLAKRREDIIGRSLAEILGEQAFAAITPHVERVLRGETVEFEMEIPYIHPGRTLVRAIYTPEVDERGEVVGWIASLRDVTEQRRAQQALRESEERFRVMADAAPVLIWLSGPDKLCTWFNQPWLEFTGRTLEQELGNGWAEGVHPEDLDRCLQTYVESFDARRPFSMEYRLKRHDGKYRWVLDRGVPRTSGSGEFAGYIGSCLDITERKQSEDALREADRRKDEFLATLAHELRNPLAPVRNAVEILRLKGPPTPELSMAREIIDRQMRQMTRLIDDLMDVSRITRNRLELRRERIDLKTVVQIALEASREQIEAAGHALTVTLPKQPVLLQADPMRLAQVFANLLSNAAKFTPPKGRIELAAERSGNEVVVAVRDNGIGMPAETLPRIFEVFVQGEHSLERTRGGLGIGLTLVKQLLEMHGGRIEARSAGPGKGSEFIARLPLEVASAVEETSPRREEPQRPPAASGRILVADDNLDSTATLRQMLELLGYETCTAHDGVEALRAAEEFRPEVAILDIGMPKTNGYDVAREIRQRSWGREVILIALTGWGQDEDKQRAFEAGFDHHLVKPVDPDALAKLLASAQHDPIQSAG